MSTPAPTYIEPLPETIQYEECPSHHGYGHISPLWDSSCSLYPERELRRIADCWNACAGIKDPAAAIQAAMDTLEQIGQHLRKEHGAIEMFQDTSWLDQNPIKFHLNFRTVRLLLKALNLLTPKP